MTDVISMLKAFGEQMQTMNSQINTMNDKMDTKLDDLKKEVQDLRQDNGVWQGELSAVRNEVTELRKENITLQQKNSDLHTRLEEIEDRIDDLEGRSKRNNLIFSGLPKRQGETSADCEGLLRDSITDKLDRTDDVIFDRVHRLSGKERSSSSTNAPLNNSITLTTSTTTTITTAAATITTPNNMSGSSKKDGTRDLATEARSFNSSLTNVFLIKKRDQQSRHLLEKAQSLIDALLAENQKLSATRSGPSTPRQARSAGGMGQLWVKLDELKRENDDLRRQRVRSQEDRCSSPKDNKGPGDVIISDLQKTKTDNESLKVQVAQLQKMVKELQAVNANLQDEYKRSKAALDAAQRSVEKTRHDYKKLESSLASIKTENDALKQKSGVLDRITSSPVKTVAMVRPMDNRLTENISERCRPSTIALRYNTLESQQWVDAKEAIEDGPGSEMEEGDIVSLLCQGLMSTYAASQRLYENVETVMAELLRRPTLAAAVIENRLVSTCQPAPLPDELSDLIKQKLRQTVDSVESDVIAFMARENQDTDTRNTLQKLSATTPAVHNYLTECASTTWQMVVQNPPMKLVADDPTFDDVRHKLWWSCDQSRARKVDMFVWPVLFDYDQGNILVKGCVCAS